MVDVQNIEASLNTTILGYQFANPFFISPAAKAQYAHPDAELNLMKGAGAGGIPYIVSFPTPSEGREQKPRKKAGQLTKRNRKTGLWLLVPPPRGHRRGRPPKPDLLQPGLLHPQRHGESRPDRAVRKGRRKGHHLVHRLARLA
jgi:hypothetical protein